MNRFNISIATNSIQSKIKLKKNNLKPSFFNKNNNIHVWNSKRKSNRLLQNNWFQIIRIERKTQKSQKKTRVYPKMDRLSSRFLQALHTSSYHHLPRVCVNTIYHVSAQTLFHVNSTKLNPSIFSNQFNNLTALLTCWIICLAGPFFMVLDYSS